MCSPEDPPAEPQWCTAMPCRTARHRWKIANLPTFRVFETRLHRAPRRRDEWA